MGNVVDFKQIKTKRTHEKELSKLKTLLSHQITKMLYDDQVPCHEVLHACCEEIGYFLGISSADIDAAASKMKGIISDEANNSRDNIKA
jgi:hypothetical protein